MSNDLCSPYKCNICLMFKIYPGSQNPSTTINTLPHVLTCSGCQLVKYCNIEHQKLDWPIHKEFCEALQKIKQISKVAHPLYVTGIPQSKEDIEKAILQLKYLLRNALSRNLQYHEEELSSFPPFCGLCFKFQKLKVVCMNCYCQAYCTEQHRELHKEEHRKVCEKLKVYYCPYKVLPLKGEYSLQFQKRVDNLDQLDLLKCLEKVFSINPPLKPCESIEEYQLYSWAADFSCIMTICYAKNLLKIQHINYTKFAIFILGATVEAILWFREIHCKLLFLQYPQITLLVLKFIGPEVVEPKYKELKFTFLGSERLIKFKIYKGVFQDYCKDHRMEPNLIIAFNCGFSEFSQCYNYSSSITNFNTLERLKCVSQNAKDTWFGGLIEILQTFETPIVFTSFTKQEAQFDFAALKNAATMQSLKVHIDHILKVKKNPFSDLRPLRQWYTNDQEEFYYRNGYIQAIRTKLKQ